MAPLQWKFRSLGGVGFVKALVWSYLGYTCYFYPDVVAGMSPWWSLVGLGMSTAMLLSAQSLAANTVKEIVRTQGGMMARITTFNVFGVRHVRHCTNHAGRANRCRFDVAGCECACRVQDRTLDEQRHGQGVRLRLQLPVGDQQCAFVLTRVRVTQVRPHSCRYCQVVPAVRPKGAHPEPRRVQQPDQRADHLEFQCCELCSKLRCAGAARVVFAA